MADLALSGVPTGVPTPASLAVFVRVPAGPGQTAKSTLQDIMNACAATALVAGSMSPAQFSKLDGLPASAPSTARLINTTAPLTGGGDLSADRTIAIPAATAGAAGHATAAQITKLDGIATGADVTATALAAGVALHHVGTAPAPSVSFAGGAGFSDKGLFSPASNQLGFAVGGSELWRMLSSGHLDGRSGSAALRQGTANAGMTVSGLVTSATTPAVLLDNQGSIFTGSTGVQRLVRVTAAFNQTSGAGASLLQLDATNTALGSGAQYFLDLQVSGTTVAGITNGATAALQGRVLSGTGATGSPSLSFIGGTTTGFWYKTTNTIAAVCGAAEIMTIALVGAQGQVGFSFGVAATPGITFIARTTDGFWSAAAGSIGVALGGVDCWRITNAGITTLIAASRFGSALTNGGVLVSGLISTAATPSVTLDNNSTTFAATTAIVQRHLAVTSTINQVSVAGAGFSAFQINLTNTSLDTGAQYFADFQVAGTTVSGIANGSTAATQGNFRAPAGGTAATCGYGFVGDVGTGLFRSSASTLGVATGAVSRWLFQNSWLYCQADGGGFEALGNGQLAFGSAISGNQTKIPFKFSNQSTYTGSSVEQTLVQLISTINQTSTAGFSALNFNLTNTALGSGVQYFINFQVAGTTVAAITNGSTAALRGRMLAGDGAAATPSFAFFGATGTGLYYTSSTVNFALGGVQHYTFGTGGMTMTAATAYLAVGANAAAPTYTFLADVDTGWARSAADEMTAWLGAARWKMTTTTIEPITDNVISLGVSGKRFTTLWSTALNTGDINLRDPNAAPGDKGAAHWKIVEGVDCIFAFNIRTGQKFRFAMEGERLVDKDEALIAEQRAEYGWDADA